MARTLPAQLTACGLGHLFNHLLPHGVDVFFGQRRVARLQPNRDGKAFLSVPLRSADELVKHAHLTDQRFVRPGGRVHQVQRRDICVHHEGEIAFDRLQIADL